MLNESTLIDPGRSNNMSNAQIIVTGHAGGIGTEISTLLEQTGYDVIGIDKTASKTKVKHEIVTDLRALSKTNSNWRDDLQELVGDAPLCGLINCAALQIVQSFGELSVEDLNQSLSVNCIAPFSIAQHVRAALAKNHGTIINIGSIHSRLTKANFLAYSVSKAALSGLTRALSIELGQQMRVIEIQPAAISTPMLEAGFADQVAQRALLDQFHPSGKIGKPSEVASLCLSILANDSPFLNGAVINLDGGISHVLADPALN